MGVILRLWLALVLAVLMGGGALAAIPPRPDGPVLDQADLLPPAEEAALDAKLRAYNASTGRAVIVATVASLDGLDEVTYGQQLAEAWDIGGAKTENAVLLLVAPNERRLRIATARGVQERFTDALSGRIIRDTITPRFKAGDMAGGIVAGADQIVTMMELDPAEAARRAKEIGDQEASRSKDSEGFPVVFVAIFLLFFVILPLLRSAGGRRFQARRKRGGIDPWVILWGLDALSRSSRGRGGWGGGGGFGGGGGGGFGGFSGGGGSFGGGGASGGW